MPATRDRRASHVKSRDSNDAQKFQTIMQGKLATVGKKRTRTGCLNCRRKRRKCDEKKPTCGGCKDRAEKCQWGVKVSFRPENAQSVDGEHPSMRHLTSTKAQSFQIVDVTSEVIRDYLEKTSSIDQFKIAFVDPSFDDVAAGHLETRNEPPNSAIYHEQSSTAQSVSYIEAVAFPAKSLSLPTHPDVDFLSPKFSDSVIEDGIFLPGSQYQELHAALRSKIIDTARSTVPSRLGSIEPDAVFPPLTQTKSVSAVEDDYEESRRLAHISPEDEYILWQNYISEVAGWCDKFDINRHFELVLPMMAKSHPHLKYSILALSARQMERKDLKPDNSCSLALYQHAIHLLSPLLQTRTTAVLASCIVLCVLEMLSCSPKAWRRHLDGCAALIQALGISGCSGGLEQALFWTFARMDIWGSFISSERTLIPTHRWMGGRDLSEEVEMFQTGSFDMSANHIVYLCGRVIDLLCAAGSWSKDRNNRSNIFDLVNDTNQWIALFDLIEAWYMNRTEEMQEILFIPSKGQDSIKVFPTILFGNGPATSGNQMYHTAALLMLKYKPPNFSLARKPRSMLWHARRICAISISNTHHGCWTNSTQPLWIAGQLMSHPLEQEAILNIYNRIERETGWGTKWRADDLREYWGNDNQ
ncbi:C6 transcription factor [Acrodontium crateriforme]|uniref:C6 transcription factor n=1 Tax=Acrodontium crateriforme TaxID=150365 RepID=A0AAQ3R3N8_9PEZI|nr:C6 transcription factor [Acrodontium crateriforme]